MKKIFRTVAALAVVMFAGCTTDLENEVVAPGVGAGQTTVTVGIADTKTYLGDLENGTRKVYWEAEDQIAINGVASTAVELNEEKTAGAFTFDAELTHPYSVLYPAEMYKDAQTITLPAIQASATGSFGGDAAPMAAYQAEAGTVTLHHLAGVVRLQVTLPAESTHGHHELNKVEFRGKAGEQVSGDFAIDYAALTLTGLSTAEADKVVTAKAFKGLAAGETDDVFIVVPAQEYAEGFTVRLIDDAGHYMDIASKAMTIEKGEIKAMPVVEFVPTGTLVGVEIASAQDLVAFANAYNAGDYAEVEPLNVVLTNDIVFDDATNAAWTPIGVPALADGEVDNYFGGCVDGQGFSIKNWNSTRPLFAYTDASAVIENITIDASCTLTANYADGVNYYGAFVGYHRGTLVNCHVNANLVATGDWGTAEPHVGALVGRVVVGTVENCTVNGDVSIEKTLTTNGKTTYCGGAVGRVSNSAGVLKGITVNGNVSLRSGSTYIAEGSANNSDAYIKYGGVVGALAGTCTDCHLPNATQTFFYGNYVYGADPADVVATNNYRTQSVGGIVGEVTEDGSVSNCNMYAAITFNQYNGEKNGASGDVSRYLYAGGIAGIVYGEVSNCNMYASIMNRSSCLQQFIGGVVGNVQPEGSVHYCANEGVEIAAGTTSLGYYQARNNNLGGVIGITYSTDLSNLTNKANIGCSRMNSKDSATLSMGGIIGKIETTSGEIDGKGALVNYGKISSNHGQYANSYTAIGGVIGEAKCSVKGVVNEGSAYYTVNVDAAVHKNIYVGGVVGYANGELSLASSEHKGTAYINIYKAVDQKHYNLCVGGVLGTNKDGKVVTISNCTNSGSAAVQGGGSKVNGRSLAVGGIVGALTGGASSISGCSNVGCVSNTSSNNTTSAWVIRAAGGSNYIGGIAGYVEGAEGDLLEVTNCATNRTEGTSDKVGNGTYAIYTLRGAVGALVGGAKYGDVKNGTVTTFIYNTNSTVTGSIVGAITNSNVDNCVVTDSSLNPHTGCLACGGGLGQVVASTVSNITLNGITILEPSATATGAIVGNSDAASTYSNIKVKGSIGGTAITASSPMIAVNAGATIDVTILE